MKQSKKLLCMLLVVIMAFSSISVGVSAAYTPYTSAAGRDCHGEAYLSSAQRSSMLMDYLDGVLKEQNIYEKINYGVGSITLDCRTLDSALDSVVKLYTSTEYDIITTFVDLADLEDLNYSRIRGGYRRTTAGITDLDLLFQLVQFINDNSNLVYKFFVGTLDLGFLEKWVKLEPPEFAAKLNLALYNALIDKSATAVPAGKTADAMIQSYVDTMLLGGTDYKGRPVEGYLPSMEGKTSVTAYSLYQFIENAANAAMTDIVLPLVNTKIKRYVQEFFGVVFAGPEDTVGDWSGVSDFAKENINLDYHIDGYTWGATSEGIFGQLNDFIAYVMGEIFTGESFWEAGGNEKLGQNIGNLLKFLYDNFADELLPTSFEKKPDEEVKAMSLEELVVYIGSAFLEKELDYVIIPDNCTTIEELACYAAMAFAAEIIPEQNYQGRIDLGLAKPDKDLLLQIGADVGRYYINAYTNINIKSGLSFENTLLACVNWALDNENFGGIFASTGVTPASTDTVWQKIDKTIFKVIPLSFFGGGVTGSYDLVMNHIVNAVLDLDFDSFLSIFYKNSTGPLTKNAIQFVIYLLNNILGVVCGGKTIIPASNTTVASILTDDNLGKMVQNILAGFVAQGQTLFQSVMQFITPALGLEDGLSFLNPTPPANYGQKTMSQLKALCETLGVAISGYPEDDYETDMDKWNHRTDYDLFTYRKFQKALSSANGFVADYEYDSTVEGADMTGYTAEAITLKAYLLQYYFDRLEQREACITQLSNVITMADEAGYNKNEYRPIVWDAYQKALKFARTTSEEAIYADEDEEIPYLKQSKVNVARRNLIVMMKVLENKSADMSELEYWVKYVQGLDLTQYTPESVAESKIEELLAAAEDMLMNTTLTADDQHEVDAMVLALKNAVAMLVPIETDIKITPIDEQSTVVIDNDKKFIYGLNEFLYEEELLTNYITATGDGEIRVTKKDSASGYVGTGSVVELVVDNNVVDSYEIVIFGDLSGDALIDESDYLLINMYMMWVYDIDEASPIYLAGDLNGDDSINEVDSLNVSRVFSWIIEINQADPYNFITAS